MSMMILAAAQAAEEGLTAEQIVSSLPFDAFSIFALLLLAASFAVVVYFGTRSWAAPDEKPRGQTPVATTDTRSGTPSGEGRTGGGRRAA